MCVGVLFGLLPAGAGGGLRDLTAAFWGHRFGALLGAGDAATSPKLDSAGILFLRRGGRLGGLAGGGSHHAERGLKLVLRLIALLPAARKESRGILSCARASSATSASRKPSRTVNRCSTPRPRSSAATTSDHDSS